MEHEQLMARLHALAEPAYAKFSSALIPGCPPMLGVRLPALRALAKELAAGPDPLAPLTSATFEERMLHGMVLGCAKLPDAERRALLEAFLPEMDNWSLCDSTAAGCKFMAKAPQAWLPWLQALALRQQEFAARFGIVCLMDHFSATAQGRRLLLQSCAAAPCPALYTRLGIAWAVSVAAVKEPDLGLAFLRRSTLDDFSHNKAIQKICESRRATPGYKAAVRALRR